MLAEAKIIYGSEEEPSFIVQYFEAFYCEVVHYKEKILAQNTGLNYTSAPGTSITPELILENLHQLLKAQAADAARFGGEFASKFYTDAQFVMAALADEVFLHLEWNGKSYWENHLLESRLYNTHTAGQSFFEKIDHFLKERDLSCTDIAMLYLLALGLGFKGKYRTLDDQGKIAKYRNELYLFINHRNSDLFKPRTQLIPDSYFHTLDNEKITYLNDFRPWLVAFAISFMMMMGISYGVWYSITGKIRSSVESILQNQDKTH